MKIFKMLLLSLFCLMLCFGCGKKENENREITKTQSTETQNDSEDIQDKAAKTDSRTDNEMIAEAMEKTSKMDSFKTAMKGRFKLGGKSINEEFEVISEIHVVQGTDRRNLQMTMQTEINPGNVVTTAYYKDGWYYVDDGINRDKQEKSPEEVLGVVTDITDMVMDASDKIENISVKEDGTDKVYSYELPAYIAEEYFSKMMTEMGTEDTILENASVEVEGLELVSEVNAEGLLIRQEISIVGTLKKAIVSIPAKAQVTAEFVKTDEKELKME